MKLCLQIRMSSHSDNGSQSFIRHSPKPFSSWFMRASEVLPSAWTIWMLVWMLAYWCAMCRMPSYWLMGWNTTARYALMIISGRRERCVIERSWMKRVMK